MMWLGGQIHDLICRCSTIVPQRRRTYGHERQHLIQTPNPSLHPQDKFGFLERDSGILDLNTARSEGLILNRLPSL